MLRAVVRYLHRKLLPLPVGKKPIQVDLVSPTGISALQIGGRTIYVYAGWTPKSEENPLALLEKKAGQDRVWERLSKTDVLIIDEISMVSNFTLTRLDRVMQAARLVKAPLVASRS